MWKQVSILQRKPYGLQKKMELDLVEISPNAQPPVCKIVDYKKFLYEQKKRAKELKAKATKVENQGDSLWSSDR